jgi:hypothetical protein
MAACSRCCAGIACIKNIEFNMVQSEALFKL